jgi:hypothetical protein
MNPLLEKKFEGFANLSDEECGIILEKYLLEGLESEVLFEREIITKFLAYPYPSRKLLGESFTLAVRRSKQIIGQKTVGEWLKKYSLAYANQERTPNTFFEFVKNDTEANILNKRNQISLMRILRMYDYLLLNPFFELDDIRMSIFKFPMYLDDENLQVAPVYREDIESRAKERSIKVSKIALSNALQQYPNLGEQSVTGNLLKLKYFPNPVRPSIKNWITDFHDNMGAGKHSMIDRGNYLFHSENGKKLTPAERQKVSLILKSLEENMPLSIDTQTQAIVFDNAQSAPSSGQYAANVQPESQPTFRSADNARTGSGQEQKDIFQRYTARGGFSPNFKDIKKSSGNFSAINKDTQKTNYFQAPKPEPKPEPKIKPDLGSENYFSNFASARKDRNEEEKYSSPGIGTVSFSSPQKFTGEQTKKISPEKKPAGMDMKMPLQENKIFTPPKPVQPKSQWHLEPTEGFYEENNNEPKLDGNIVNLKQ